MQSCNIGKLQFAICVALTRRDLFGQSIVEVHQEIAAALISPALAGGLKAKAGTTALEVQRTYKLTKGKVAQVAINTHPASRFRHSMTMRRVRG